MFEPFLCIAYEDRILLMYNIKAVHSGLLFNELQKYYPDPYFLYKINAIILECKVFTIILYLYDHKRLYVLNANSV